MGANDWKALENQVNGGPMVERWVTSEPFPTFFGP